MKKTLTNIGGLILFYMVIVFGVLLLNLRFAHLNSDGITELDNNLTFGRKMIEKDTNYSTCEYKNGVYFVVMGVIRF